MMQRLWCLARWMAAGAAIGAGLVFAELSVARVWARPVVSAMRVSAAGAVYYKAPASVPPPGSLGYVFFNTATKPSGVHNNGAGETARGSNSTYTGTYSKRTGAFHPVPWATVTLDGQAGYGGGQFAPKLKIHGKAYLTGQEFNNGANASAHLKSSGGTLMKGDVATLLTIKLGPGAPRSFQFGELDDGGINGGNHGGAVNLLRGNVGYGTYRAKDVKVLASIHDKSRKSTLYAFYYFDVTNAKPGESFTLADTSNGYYGMATSGVTFDKVPVGKNGHADPGDFPKPPAAPTAVFWSSSPVRPGQVAIVEGSGLQGCMSIILRTTDKTAVACKPLRDSADSLAFRVPRRLTAGPIRVHLQAAGGQADFWLNRPTIWWTQGNRGEHGSPGGWMEIFGTCLDGAAQIDGHAVDSIRRSAYVRWIPLSKGMRPGSHTVVIGGGPKCHFLVVASPAVATVKATIRATGGNDSVAIQNAVNRVGASKGGGVVLLPSRRYVLNATLLVPPHVVLRGAGEHHTLLSWHFGMAKPPKALIRGTGYFAVESLTLHCGNCDNGIVSSHDPPWATTDVHAPGHITIRRVRMRMDPFMGHQKQAQITAREDALHAVGRGDAALYLGGPDVRILHCNIYAAHMGFYLVNCSGLIVRDNRLSLGYQGWNDFEGCQKAIIAHNIIRGGAALDSGGVVLSCYSHNFSQNVYCAHNDIRRLYGWDREGMAVDAGGGEYEGAIADVHGNSVTLASAPKVPPQWGPTLGRGCALYIVNGRGKGQYRRVMAIDGRHVKLKRPFAVNPNASSDVSLNILQRNYLFIQNHVADAGCGLEIFAGAVNCIAFQNTAVRTGGFDNIGQPYGGFTQPSWYIQWLGNRADGLDNQLGIYGLSWLGVAEPTTLGCVARGNQLDGGGIRIGGSYGPPGGHAGYPFTQNVLVEGNTVRNTKVPFVCVAGTRGVVCTGNSFPCSQPVADSKQLR